MKKILASLFAAFALCLSSAAHAVPVTWTLVDAKFDDNTSLTGFFTYDASTDVYSNWSLTVVKGLLTPYTYKPTTSFVFDDFSSAIELLVAKNNESRYVNLSFAEALTDAGGLVLLNTAPDVPDFTASSWECDNCDNTRWLVSGSVQGVPVPVPEPASLALLGVALAGLAVSRRKQR